MIPTPQPPVRGVLPIAPTPFTGSGDIDVAGQRRVLDCMIDQGVDAICVLANFSEQFLLTDDERNELTDVCLTHVGDRVPVIVTCSHFSTRIAAERGRRAAALGASMVMLMPPYHGVGLRVDEDAMLAHFAHLFSGSSYAAGYYVYQWAEVLDADGFDAFVEAGDPFDPEVAGRLLRYVYSSGGTLPPAEAYRAFRGRDPIVGPLLAKLGLADVRQPA